MVNVQQVHNLPTQSRNKTGHKPISAKFCSDYVNVVDVENQ